MIHLNKDQYQLRIDGKIYQYGTNYKKLVDIATQMIYNLFEKHEQADIINIDTGEIITIRRSRVNTSAK